MTFEDMETKEEIIDYQKKVLSRNGGRSNPRIYHYTDISSLKSMIESGYIWLLPFSNMNDTLEAELIQLAKIRDYYYTCFSKANQNIAMFKMYAEDPSGVMISISVKDAKKMLEKKPKIVEDNRVLDDNIDAELYWIEVCYKDLESNIISTPTKKNNHLEKPLVDLAGAIKLSGWEFEKELRLCAKKRLYENQHLAVQLPKKVEVVLTPGFDREKYKMELAYLTQNGLELNNSQYESWLNI